MTELSDEVSIEYITLHGIEESESLISSRDQCSVWERPGTWKHITW